MATSDARNPLFGLKGRKVGKSADRPSAWLSEIAQTAELVDGLAPGQRLFFWIGQAAKRVREDAGVQLEAIAVEMRNKDPRGSKEMLNRFEKGHTKPQDLERALVAYAKLTSTADPRDIVAQGVRLWYEQGVSPAVEIKEDVDADEDETLPPGEMPA